MKVESPYLIAKSQMESVLDYFQIPKSERRLYREEWRLDRNGAKKTYEAIYASLQVEVRVPESP